MHGITETTCQNYLMDAGAVYKNYVDFSNPGDLLGASRGGNSCEIVEEIRNMTADGERYKRKGCQRIIGGSAKLTVKLVEVTAENIQLALAGSELAAGVVTGGQIKESDYLDNVTFVGEKSGGGGIVITLENALSTEGLKFTFNDKDEAVLEITFEAFADDVDEVPWTITEVAVGS